VAEGLEIALPIRDRLVAVREDDAARAHRCRDDAGTYDAVAYGAGGLIPGTADDRCSGGQSGGLGGGAVDPAADHDRLMHRRQEVGVDSQPAEQPAVPVTRLHVEQQRAGRVAHLRGVLTCQPQPDVVLRQQHLERALEDARIMPADPEDLRRREARQRDVVDHADEPGPPAGEALDFLALGRRPLVVPQQGGAQRLPGAVHEDAAVHLTAEPDAGDLGRTDAGLPADVADAADDGPPPVVRVLLRPAGPRRVDGVFRARRGQNLALRVAEQRFRGGCADVDPEQKRHSRASLKSAESSAPIRPEYTAAGRSEKPARGDESAARERPAVFVGMFKGFYNRIEWLRYVSGFQAAGRHTCSAGRRKR